MAKQLVEFSNNKLNNNSINKQREAKASETIHHSDLQIDHDAESQNNDNHFNMKDKENTKMIFTNQCNGISQCQSINRITKCLQFYQSLDLKTEKNVLIEYLNENNYPFLLNDYNHILIQHLGDNKPIDQTRNEYEEINQFIMNQIKQCELEKCNKLNRNTRNREKQQLSLNNNNNNNNNDNLFNFYVDTLDTIHCFLIHTFDIGLRIKSDELQKINTINDNDDDEEEQKENTINDALYTQDYRMKELKQILSIRRKRLENIRGSERSERNKFITEHKECVNKNEERKDDALNTLNGCYSFGVRYYYWEKYKGLKDIEHEGPNQGFKYKNFYIRPKYDNLQLEITNNNICVIDLVNFNAAVCKSEKYIHEQHAKTIRAAGSLCSDYGIKEMSPITSEHLLSVILYTDYDSLSYNFSSTFRRLHKLESFGDQKRRNKEYGIWSKLLRETVELYGTEMADCKIDIFYHGVSKLIFSSFVSYFGSPTSTTAQIEVATVFANESGLILELERSSHSLKYFNCTWLSCYGNEDERLLIGGLFPIHFGSIREMDNNIDYRYFIHALTSFNYAITGQQTFSSQHEVNKNDVKIIKSLRKHYDDEQEYKNKFPVYINNIFKEFCNQKKIIKINQQRLHEIMEKSIFKKECDKGINLKIFNIFKNLERISVEYDLIFRPSLNEKYFESMLNDLGKMGVNKNLIIELNKVVYIQDVLNKYQSEFEKKNWKIIETGTVKNKSLSISPVEIK